MINRTAKEVAALAEQIGGLTAFNLPAAPFSKRRNFLPVFDPQGHDGATKYSAWIRALKDQSGVYIVADHSGQILYVGESHTGRLYDTITRHFRKWDDEPERIHFTFDPAAVLVAVERTEAGAAVRRQNELIRKLRPKLNTAGAAEEPNENPF